MLNFLKIVKSSGRRPNQSTLSHKEITTEEKQLNFTIQSFYIVLFWRKRCIYEQC